MNNTSLPIAAVRPTSRPAPRRAFTLVELLVVIGIIALLVSILIPVVTSVRRAAYKVNTTNEISVLAGAIDSYYGDFKAYPGPISEANLIGTSSTAGNDPNRCTSSQNLVWGLEGGWEPFNSNSYSPHFSSATVGTGAMSFNNAANTSPGSTSASQTPRYRPYLDGTYLLPQPWKTPSGADPYGTAVAADSL